MARSSLTFGRLSWELERLGQDRLDYTPPANYLASLRDAGVADWVRADGLWRWRVLEIADAADLVAFGEGLAHAEDRERFLWGLGRPVEAPPVPRRWLDRLRRMHPGLVGVPDEVLAQLFGWVVRRAPQSEIRLGHEGGWVSVTDWWGWGWLGGWAVIGMVRCLVVRSRRI